jgi:CubicO group peptidase (beta-lactamase class C family)
VDAMQGAPPTRESQVTMKNHGDGVAIVQDAHLLHEKYFHGFNEHAQHIWYSMSKSLTSTATGRLVAEGKVDSEASPAQYIPKLKGSSYRWHK